VIVSEHAETIAAGRRLPFKRTEALSFLLIFLGAVLGMTVHMSLLLLLALGAFSPGLLRELGLLADRDEYQRQAALQAGYRAYLITGFALVIAIVALRWRVLNLDNTDLPGHVVLILLLAVYFLSYLFSYWGPQRASFRILIAFGLFWLVFVVISHLEEPGHLFAEAFVVAPFFLLAFAGRRWPRISGLVLIALSVVVLFRFGLIRRLVERPFNLEVILLFWLPLFASGLALLLTRRDEG
jgi:hypothetical protein